LILPLRKRHVSNIEPVQGLKLTIANSIEPNAAVHTKNSSCNIQISTNKKSHGRFKDEEIFVLEQSQFKTTKYDNAFEELI
jgi:hypothetical protein